MKSICISLFLIFLNNIFSQCWEKVAADFTKSLAIKSDGSMWAWGLTNTNNDTASLIPFQIGIANNWKEVSCGGGCIATKTDNTLWNYNSNNQTFQQIGTGTDWNKISHGVGYSLALKNNGSLWAWGNNNSGQLGDGTITNRLNPVLISNEVWSVV